MCDIIENNSVPIKGHDELPLAGHVISDATLHRIAAIFIDSTGQIVHQSKETVDDNCDIQTREAQATILGLKMLPRFKVQHRVICIIDNASWLYTILNSRGIPNQRLSEQKIELIELQRRNNFQIEARYVPSQHNAADDLTRGHDRPTIQRIQETMAHQWRVGSL